MCENQETSVAKLKPRQNSLGQHLRVKFHGQKNWPGEFCLGSNRRILSNSPLSKSPFSKGFSEENFVKFSSFKVFFFKGFFKGEFCQILLFSKLEPRQNSLGQFWPGDLTRRIWPGEFWTLEKKFWRKKAGPDKGSDAGNQWYKFTDTIFLGDSTKMPWRWFPSPMKAQD